jgi:hypothetical protein
MNSAKTVNREEIEKTNCKVYYIVTVHKNHPVFGLSIVLSIFHFILCFFRPVLYTNHLFVLTLFMFIGLCKQVNFVATGELNLAK